MKNEITILGTFINDLIEIEVSRDTLTGYQVRGFLVEKDGLRDFIDDHSPCIVWQDGEQVTFCAMSGCNEPIRADAPCPLCSGCLLEHQQEQADYCAEYRLCAYAGVIG